jgi:DNA repair exonuclease SbcCD ATPase subunit
MSNHTKAWAIVREVPDHELRDALIDAHERMLDVADELDAAGDLDVAVYQATEWRSESETLQDIAIKTNCNTDGVADWVEDAIEKLEAQKQDTDGTACKKALADKSEQLKEALERIEALEAERALLKVEVKQLEAAAELPGELPGELRNAVGDVLAMSRKLTSFCEVAGIKPATLRVTRTRRKAS